MHPANASSDLAVYFFMIEVIGNYKIAVHCSYVFLSKFKETNITENQNTL